MHTITVEEVARNRLVCGHLDLVDKVISIMWRRWGPHITFIGRDEAYQLGCMGLMTAAKNFVPRPELQTGFEHYAAPYIKGAILRRLIDTGLVHVPPHSRFPEAAGHARQMAEFGPKDEVVVVKESEQDYATLHDALKDFSKDQQRWLKLWSEGVLMAEIEQGVSARTMCHRISWLIKRLRKRMEGH